MRPRTSRFVVIALVLFGFGLRMVQLNGRGLWYDEAFAILYASRSFAEMVYGTLTQVGGAAADVHPLYYYFALHVWMGAAGDSVLAARFFSVLFGTATIPVVFQTARLLFDTRVALASAAVATLAPFHIAYSQESRMYAELGFWSALALLGFAYYWRTGNRRGWFAFVLAGAAALYSHNLAVVFFAALGLWALVDAGVTRSARMLISTVLGGLAMTLLWLPWLVNVPSQFGKIDQAYWVPAPTLATLVQTLLVFAFDFDNASPPAPLLPVLLFGALLIVVLAALELARRMRRMDARSRAAVGFAAAMGIVPIAVLFAISQWHSVYIIRGLMPAFLCCVVLTGWTLAGMPRRAGQLTGAALAALAVICLPAYYSYSQFPRSPFQAADRALAARAQPGDVIVHDNKLSFFPMYYYDSALDQSFIADPPGAASDTLAYPTQQALGLYASPLDTAVQAKSRVWFVIFQEAIDQADEQGHPNANLTWLQDRFGRVTLDRFNDLDVYLFER